MKLIAITLENFVEKEATAVTRLFEQGLETLHLRKPTSSKDECIRFFERIDPVWHNHIVLHDHFTIANTFHVKGVHLNRRNSDFPEQSNISLSCSCHSLEEVIKARNLDYCFLSPIFDSVSKQGYRQGFEEKELLEAKKNGIIHSKVMALGGVMKNNIKILARYGFGGVVVLGSLWGSFATDQDIDAVIERFQELNAECKNTGGLN